MPPIDRAGFTGGLTGGSTMGRQGNRIFQVTAERGFPDPWLSFGDCLCDESRLSTEVKQAIETSRKEATSENRERVQRLFDAKAANLVKAAEILETVLVDYDSRGEWERLDQRAARLDIDDVAERWSEDVAFHPFPIVVESLKFNWTYMKENGVRAFYEMTTGYIRNLQGNTNRWRTAWNEEVATGVIDRLTTIVCDLASIEAPMHCDVCKKTITALIYLEE
ncbi:MAG: hypothetical protein ACRDQZ_24640 [Mycobacteriales bacterium]